LGPAESSEDQTHERALLSTLGRKLMPRDAGDTFAAARRSRSWRDSRRCEMRRTAPCSPPASVRPDDTDDALGSPSLTDPRDSIVALIARWGYNRRAEPFELSSSGWSRDYVDGKRAIARGSHLQQVGKAISEVAGAAGVSFEAVGGLTMGADPIAVAVAMVCDVNWFSVRKSPKHYGKQKKIEGTDLSPGTRVLLVDDVATTGRSMLDALDVLEDEGVDVVMAIPLVDRGDVARPAIEKRGLLYEPLITYRDLGIEPIQRGRIVA
jgi:orotate phosphoribosyltransferase